MFFSFLPKHFDSRGTHLNYFNFIPSEGSDRYVFYFFGLISLVLLLGLYRRWVSLVLFLFWIVECNHVAFEHNAGTFLVAYLLLILASTPEGVDWGIRKLPFKLGWALLLALLFSEVFSEIQYVVDLPAFGIKPDVQNRPPGEWLPLKLGSIVVFFALMPFFRLRKFAWTILFFSKLAWLVAFRPQDSTLIMLISLLFLFNGEWLTEKSDPKLKPIIFFDGLCVLCNRFTKFLFKEDFAHHFYYAPLQGKTAKEILPRDRVSQPGSIIFLQGGKVYDKSEAIIKIFSEVGGIWTPFFFAKIVPKSIADKIYDFVASNRYSWFGSLSECEIPNEIEKAFQKP